MKLCILVLFLSSFMLFANDSKLDQQELKNSTEDIVNITEHSIPQNSGQKIYDTYCYVCHKDGLVGAPRFRSKDWSHRISKNIDELVDSAVKGINSMPPKGTCSECSEEEMKAAIQYMLPTS